MKFQRTWTAVIAGADNQQITVAYPLTIMFHVSRNTLASANTGNFRLYNLSEKNRMLILKDRWDPEIYRQIIVYAGYQSEPKLPVIFQGNILSAQSYREGVDWITEIEALDGGFGIINGQVSTTLPEGWNFREIFNSTVQTMKNVTRGAVGDFGANNSRGVTLMGNSWDVLNKAVQDGDAFIDNEQVNVLRNGEYRMESGLVTTINADSGLLGTPRRYDKTLQISVLFEPRMVVGQKIELESLETVFNGVYKIIGIAHRATISEAIGGDAVTTITVFRDSLLRGVAA
jgi:hypothetical protein